jgi:geranylgeranyl reductase family protein
MTEKDQIPGVIYSYDIIIAGAGPAGSGCARALRNAGLKVAILDKASFPRDKICGDAISTTAVEFLNKNYPEYAKQLSAFEPKSGITSARLVAASGKKTTIHWHSKAYNCARLQFDNFLFELVKKNQDLSIHLNTQILDAKVGKDSVKIDTSAGLFEASLVISCDGAQSLIAKKLAGFSVNRKHYGGAVRAYYEIKKNNCPEINEVFFSGKYPQGYFWIFPVSPSIYNVGFGMLSQAISKKRVDLTKALTDIIDEFPELRNRFSDAVMQDKPRGFGLSLGTRKLPISGDRFLLCGDAASLIDPLSGDGIGNAMISGHLAAQHVLKHKADMIFSAEINKEYDMTVYARLWKDLRKKTYALRIASRFPFLIGFGIRLLSIWNKFSKIPRDS